MFRLGRRPRPEERGATEGATGRQGTENPATTFLVPRVVDHTPALHRRSRKGWRLSDTGRTHYLLTCDQHVDGNHSNFTVSLTLVVLVVTRMCLRGTEHTQCGSESKNRQSLDPGSKGSHGDSVHSSGVVRLLGGRAERPSVSGSGTDWGRRLRPVRNKGSPAYRTGRDLCTGSYRPGTPSQTLGHGESLPIVKEPLKDQSSRERYDLDVGPRGHLPSGREAPGTRPWSHDGSRPPLDERLRLGPWDVTRYLRRLSTCLLLTPRERGSGGGPQSESVRVCV